MSISKHLKEHAILKILASESSALSRNRAELGVQYKWSDMTNTANTGGVNTVTTIPGNSSFSALRIEPSGAAASVRYNLPAAIDLSLVDTVYVPIIPRDIGTGRSLSIWLYFASDTGMVNRAQYRIFLRAFPPNQAHVVAVSLKQARSSVDGAMTDGWDATGGAINWAAITTVQVTCEAVSAASADNYFFVGDIFTDAPRTPAFMIGFDKNLNSQYQNALPLLRKYDIPATFYIEKFRIGQAGQFGLAEMQALSDMGHQIALHSYSKYLNTNDDVEFPTAQSITDEIDGFMVWAAANGLNFSPNHCCQAIASPWESPATYAHALRAIDGYTGGGITSIRMSSMGYSLFRPAQQRGGISGYALPTFPIVATSSQTDINNFMDKCVNTQGVASYYTHEVLSVASGNGTSIAVLDATLAKAAELRAKGLIKIKTA